MVGRGIDQNRAKQLGRTRKRATPAQGGDQAIRYGWLEESITFRLRRAQDASAQTLLRPAGQEDLRLGSFALLSLIAENPGINQTVLSRANGRNKSTLTSSLRVLENRGFIVRDRGASDLRNYTLRLTDEGQEELRILRGFAEAHEQKLRKIVGSSRAQEFLETLERITLILEG